MFNLKDIISSIADVGKKIFKKKDSIKKNDVESIVSLCDDLLSNKGAAFGITVAREITDLYQTLSDENKLIFFKKINEKYKASHSEVDEAINIYKKKQDDKNLFNLSSDTFICLPSANPVNNLLISGIRVSNVLVCFFPVVSNFVLPC